MIMRNSSSFAEKIFASRIRQFGRSYLAIKDKAEEEGGCGVTGFACNIPVPGRHLFEPSCRMHNRGNGKGGGIAAVGLNAEMLGVTQEVLESHYMLNVAILDPSCFKELRSQFVAPFFEIEREEVIDHIPDYRTLPGVEIRPPDVWRAFVRVKPAVLKQFIEEQHFEDVPERNVEDEFVSQNTFRLNRRFYSSVAQKQAFVLSHGRNMMILKIVGYAENVIRYYKLDDFLAHVWIAHQRYPTRGRFWHPGGAHPFVGMNEALVHNGDIANYHAIHEYLGQRGIEPLFLTDTEVSVLLFDLWNRIYGYPLEVIFEALAPTGELDFDLLPPPKQILYDRIQMTHLSASPDGPWFFIIARNIPEKRTFQLIGITDTSMLRPQVFSLYDGDVQIGLTCSEKQAIDATLRSLASEDSRFSAVADSYWNARGGSFSDGGAFLFNVTPAENGEYRLTCYDKFGREIKVEARLPLDNTVPVIQPQDGEKQISTELSAALEANDAHLMFQLVAHHAAQWDYNTLRWVIRQIGEWGRKNNASITAVIEGLTYILDRRFPLGNKKRSALVWLVTEELFNLLRSIPRIDKLFGVESYCRIDFQSRLMLRPPIGVERVLIVDAKEFAPEGEDCDAYLLSDAYALGWRKFIVFDLRGQRFEGCGFGAKSDGVRIDLYGSSGDYVASGIDGMELHVHGNAQDQVAQIMKRGKLVIHGDVGQCFMYGAKGGTVYVLGNAAGRPLINAAGNPRVVINGTALDFLAESFMAGDPLNGGGFVILNGLARDEDGKIVFLDRPYPGSNLFSLASGGAIYVRDPQNTLVEEQLNGGRFAQLSNADWELIKPYLEENQRLFGISIEDLLTVNGVLKSPSQVYRKVEATKLSVLSQIPETDDSLWLTPYPPRQMARG